MSKNTKATKAPAAPKAAKATRATLPEKNGIKRPKDGGKTAVPWTIADKITEKAGRPALRSEVLTECEKKGCSPGMATSQFQNWRVFNGIAPARGGAKPAKPAKAPKAAKAPAKKAAKKAAPKSAPKVPKAPKAPAAAEATA